MRKELILLQEENLEGGETESTVTDQLIREEIYVCVCVCE